MDKRGIRKGKVKENNDELCLTVSGESSIFNHMVKYNDDKLNLTFGALSDPTRRAILSRLSKGEAQVTELAEPFGMSLPAVSKHLRVLENARLIIRKKNGRIHRFTINPEPLQSAHSWIERYEKFWTQQLESLGRYLDSTIKKEEKK